MLLYIEIVWGLSRILKYSKISRESRKKDIANKKVL